MKTLLKFTPLLLLYTVIIFLSRSDELRGDAGRYVHYAENILQGFFTDRQNPNLENGPGFPLYLALLMGLGLPKIIMELLNGVLTFFAIVFFYKTLLLFIPKRSAVVFSYALGLYYPMYPEMVILHTESLALLVICSFMYYATKFFLSKEFNYKYLISSGLLLGYLILIKVFFANVVFVVFLLAVAYALFFKKEKVHRAIAILVLAFLTTIPWLIYTYSLTGRTFYWATEGGSALYWMSSRLEGEYGTWLYPPRVVAGEIPGVHPCHVAFLDSILTKPPVERNDAFLRRAKENIRKNPEDYLMNIFSNLSCFFYNYPKSHRVAGLSLPFYTFINMFLIVPFFFSLYPAWINRKTIPFEIISFAVFFSVYFGGLLLVVAVPRYLILVLPFILLWLAFVYNNFVQIALKNLNEPGPQHNEKN